MVFYTGTELISPEEVRQQSMDFVAKLNGVLQQVPLKKNNNREIESFYYIATAYNNEEREVRWIQRTDVNLDTKEVKRVACCDYVRFWVVDYTIVAINQSSLTVGIFDGFDEFQRQAIIFIDRPDIQTLICNGGLGLVASADYFEGIAISTNPVVKFSLDESALPQVERIDQKVWAKLWDAANQQKEVGSLKRRKKSEVPNKK